MGITRSEFFARIGLLREIDPLTDLAYRFEESQQAGESDQGAAAEHKWHVSFHGSQFPGDDPKACGRAALYRMLDMPRSTGSYLYSNRRLTQLADAGKDIEDRLTMRWHNAGFLLSTPPYDPFGNKQKQDQFEDDRAWLTSTVDSIVLWPRVVMPVVAEIKSKDHDIILDMKKMIRGPDEKHVKQLKTQIAMARHDFEINPRRVQRCHNTDRMAIPVGQYMTDEVAGHSRPVPVVKMLCPQHLTTDCLYWEDLVPPSYGFLYYVSRNDPSFTYEFFYEYDPKFYEAGIAALQAWREKFIANELPHDNFVDRRYAHPFGWKWGEMPCRWCDYGDVCRIDNRRAIEQGSAIRLSESEAILEASGIRADYNFDVVREHVYRRWGYTPNGATNGAEHDMIPPSGEETDQEDNKP